MMRRSGWRILWLAPVLAASLGAADRGSASPLERAARDRDVDRVTALLAQRVDANEAGPDGTTALHWIARWNDAETARLLIDRGAKVETKNRYGATPLWIAASLGNSRVVHVLLGAGADPNADAVGGDPPIVAGALSGSVDTVRALLDYGADADARESLRGQTALMMAVGKHMPSPDVARLLVEYGADVGARSKNGMTALLFAVRQNDLNSVRLLVDAGANVNDEANAQTGALRVAIDNGHYEIAHLLIDRGANVNAPDRAGFTPLYAAIRARAGGNPERGDGGRAADGHRTIRLLQTLLAKGADVHAKLPAVRQPPNFNPDGYPQTNNVQYGGATPFWVAAVLADVEVMRLLVEAGADPRAASMEGTTPLMVAAGLGYGTRGPTSRLGGRRTDTEDAVAAAVEQLLAWGNDINAVNAKGQTALHGAVAAASPAVTRLLIDRGARLDQLDEIGRTPFIMADEHRTDKYRTNQSLDPNGIIATYAVLRDVTAHR